MTLMNSSSKLAIVIPYYKINFFEETLKSVAAQTNKNFTLYIGNDASPKNPLILIEKYFIKGSFNYYDYKDNLGGNNLASQWERILENVKEDWFQILGDDDMIAENFVEEFYKSVNILNRKKINVLKFPLKIIDQNNITTRSFSFKHQIIDRKFFLISKIEHSILSSLSENIFRTKTYLKYKIKTFPLAWHSDDCMIFEYAENNLILYNEQSSLCVRNSGVNISSITTNQYEKSLASDQFYNYIISKYYKLFTSIQKKIILDNLKKHWYYSKHKPSLKTFYFVGKHNILDSIKLCKYFFFKNINK
jgi:hypothetical protein